MCIQISMSINITERIIGPDPFFCKPRTFCKYLFSDLQNVISLFCITKLQQQLIVPLAGFPRPPWWWDLSGGACSKYKFPRPILRPTDWESQGRDSMCLRWFLSSEKFRTWSHGNINVRSRIFHFYWMPPGSAFSRPSFFCFKRPALICTAALEKYLCAAFFQRPLSGLRILWQSGRLLSNFNLCWSGILNS